MPLKSKKISLLVLVVTALVCSRVMFLFFNDPEGPNLLIVIGTAAVVYFLSLAVYLFVPSTTDFKRFSLAIFVQILLVAGLYLCLH